MTLGYLLSFLSGFVALSYEILWFRAYSFISAGAAPVFGLFLGLYLAGLALGAYVSRRFCASSGTAGDDPALLALGRFILLANVLGYLLVPLLSWILTGYGVEWMGTLPLAGVVACGLGTILPIVCHVAVRPDERAGAGVSRLYAANVAGSTAGSLLTGFWLCDVWPLRTISLVLMLLGAGMGAVTLLWSAPSKGARLRRMAVVALLAALGIAGEPWLFDGLYERLQFKFFYQPGVRFRHVVENRSGVITVSQDGTFFGGGWYDGSVNTSLDHDRNGVNRPYAIPALHASPREVLVVGLSTGSWVSVLTQNPAIERITVVEINGGYLELLPHFPEVAGVLRHPKVTIEIDDARRWLVRNRDRKFDVILSNTTVHWRSHITNLLSVEFLELAKAHLREGGLLYYGTTGSAMANRTGMTVFPYGVRLLGFLIVGERPVTFEPDRLQESLLAQVRMGKPLLDPADPGSPDHAKRFARALASGIDSREKVLAEASSGPLMTDDNMGVEWTAYPRQ